MQRPDKLTAKLRAVQFETILNVMRSTGSTQEKQVQQPLDTAQRETIELPGALLLCRRERNNEVPFDNDAQMIRGWANNAARVLSECMAVRTDERAMAVDGFEKNGKGSFAWTGPEQ